MGGARPPGRWKPGVESRSCLFLGGTSVKACTAAAGEWAQAESSQGCAHTDNCPWMVSQAAAAALPSPVRGEAKTIMWDKQPKCQHSLLLQHPVSCDAFWWSRWPEWEQFFLDDNMIFSCIETFTLLASQNQYTKYADDRSHLAAFGCPLMTKHFSTGKTDGKKKRWQMTGWRFTRKFAIGLGHQLFWCTNPWAVLLGTLKTPGMFAPWTQYKDRNQ